MCGCTCAPVCIVYMHIQLSTYHKGHACSSDLPPVTAKKLRPQEDKGHVEASNAPFMEEDIAAEEIEKC